MLIWFQKPDWFQFVGKMDVQCFTLFFLGIAVELTLIYCCAFFFFFFMKFLFGQKTCPAKQSDHEKDYYYSKYSS